MDLTPVIAGLALFALSSFIGMVNVVKLIQVYEAQHELKRGSAGWIRTISGWSFVVLWLLATWFFATIIGDWHISGDLEGAVDRSWVRLQVIMEIAIAVLDSD